MTLYICLEISFIFMASFVFLSQEAKARGNGPEILAFAATIMTAILSPLVYISWTLLGLPLLPFLLATVLVFRVVNRLLK